MNIELNSSLHSKEVGFKVITLKVADSLKNLESQGIYGNLEKSRNFASIAQKKSVSFKG